MNKYDQKKIILKAIAEVFAGQPKEIHRLLYEDLAHLYGQPNRHHHTLEHIADMLPKAEKLPLQNPRAFKAAILYHDIIFEPVRYAPTYKGISNEKHSALVCENVLETYEIPDDIIVRTKQLIEGTETHTVAEDDFEAALFMDLDKSVLGAPLDIYRQYARRTAREFLSAFTDEQYRTGRTIFLNATAARDKPTFKTAQFAHLNEQVRKNNEWELKNLRQIAYSSSYEAPPQFAL